MKRWNVRSFLAGGLVTALVLGLGVPALAATIQTAELYYNNIQIRLNGKTLVPKDANGNTVEPFVIDGTTYLPIRAVGEALGLNVSWDGPTQTVILGNDAQMGQPAAWLGEMDLFEGDATESVAEKVGLFAGTANDGSQYERVYYPSGENNGAAYLLKGQYTKFTGTFYLDEDSKNGPNSRWNTAQFEVYLDDTLVFTSKEMKPGELPQTFTINVTNAYKMEIKYTSAMALQNGNYVYDQPSYTPIGNAALWTD